MGWFGKLKVKRLFLGSDSSPSNNRTTEVTATATELNLLDGVSGLVQADFTKLAAVDATAAELNKNDDSLVGAYMAPGAGFTAATGEAHHVGVFRNGDVITTRILVDVTGLTSAGTANTFLGNANATYCHIGQVTTAVNGVVWGGMMYCLETPATADDDVNLVYSTSAAKEQGTTGGTVMINAGDATKGAYDAITVDPPANSYLYLQAGTGDKVASVYTAGQFMIELWGSPS